MMRDLEYLDDIADQSAFSGGEGGFKNGMRANPNRRCRSRKRRRLARNTASEPTVLYELRETSDGELS